MNPNLETLSSEIREYLESRGIAVFHGEERDGENLPTIHWDTQRRPDYRAFVAAAEAAGVKLVNMYVNEFSAEILDDALDRMDEVPREQRREVEGRLRELRSYAGYICQIELSFDLGQRVYLFELRTEWFDNLTELLHQTEDSFADEDDESPLGGGYFSKN
jgi:hypothetical protein